jgi:hypothetical protein
MAVFSKLFNGLFGSRTAAVPEPIAQGTSELPVQFWEHVYRCLRRDRLKLGYRADQKLDRFFYSNNKVGQLIAGFRNTKGRELEKTSPEEARVRFELNILDGFDGTMPYDRLRILYTREGRYKDAIRVCDAMLALRTRDALAARAEFDAHRKKLLAKLESTTPSANATPTTE